MLVFRLEYRVVAIFAKIIYHFFVVIFFDAEAVVSGEVVIHKELKFPTHRAGHEIFALIAEEKSFVNRRALEFNGS